jgi:hypothetical protein
MVTVARRSCMSDLQGRVARGIGNMIVPGCLLALLLPLGGAALGQWLDGSEGGLWGLAIGFLLGCVMAALVGWLLVRMKEG